MGCYANKAQLSAHAQQWNAWVNVNCVQQTQFSIANSTMFLDEVDKTIPTVRQQVVNNTQIIFMEATTEQAVLQSNSTEKICALNFASYKTPGGMYFEGSNAQEEALCHASNLYPVISNDRFKEFYSFNNKHLNAGLYGSRSIYSPSIIFFSPDCKVRKICDVITCAAPFRGTVRRYNRFPDTVVYDNMKNRIMHILNEARKNKVETLILGAYGCGVFKNEPDKVAQIFKESIDWYFPNVFKKIVFAIPAGKNYDIFYDILGK